MRFKTKKYIIDIAIAIALIIGIHGIYSNINNLVEISQLICLFTILFAVKVKINPELRFIKFKKGAKIPTKNKEDLGYDIYACFDEPYIKLEPHETKLIPTGLGSNMGKGLGVILKERGSTGSKGLGIRSGVIDSGYKGEWFVGITNHNTCPVYISKNTTKIEAEEEIIVYPYEKAICQAIVVDNYNCNIKEITKNEFDKIKTDRDTGKIGSSGK